MLAATGGWLQPVAIAATPLGVALQGSSSVNARLAAAVLGAGLAGVGVASSARAAELALEPPLACSNAGEIGFLAERALGRPLASAPPVRFVISMAAQGAGFGGRLETHIDGAEVGVRAFSAATCTELVETMALGVAIALGGSSDEVPAAASDVAGHEPNAVAPTTELATVANTPVESPPGESAAAQRDDASAPPGAPSTPSASPEVAAMAFVVGDTGTLPNPAFGVAIGAGMRWSGLELRAAGLLLPPRHGAVDGLANGEAGADIELLGGWASACAPLSLESDAVELGVCAGWEMGRLRATGTGVVRSYRKSRLWAAPRLDVAVRWALSDSALSLELLATALAPLRRDEFILKDIGDVHRPQNVIARAQVGLAWAIW